MRNTPKAFKWIVEILQRNKIPFQITGGLAAKVYGSGRPLNDIDIDIPDDKFNNILPEVKKYVTWGPGKFTDNKWDLTMMTLNFAGQEIDLSAALDVKIYDESSKTWQKVPTDLSKAEMREVYGMTVPVVPKKIL